MAVRDQFAYRDGQDKLEKCEKTWEFLMESMKGQPVEERMHTAGSVGGA